MREKYFCLDFLRAFAILLVYFLHYTTMSKTDISWFPEVIRFGWVGVDLFFVLSGFLISNQLIQGMQLNDFSLKQFYIKRIFRIVPLYYFIICCYLIIPLEINIKTYEVWKYFTFLMNLDLSVLSNQHFTHPWSLCVEEHFYLIFPLLLLLCFKFNFQKHLFVFLILVLFLQIVIRFFSWKYIFVPHSLEKQFWEYWYKYIYFPTYTRLDGLLVGILCAYILNFKKNYLDFFQKNKVIMLLLAFALVGVEYYFSQYKYSFKSTVVGYSILSIGFGLILLLLITKNSKTKWFNNYIIRNLAKISYTIYLCHELCIYTSEYFLSTLKLNSVLMFTINTFIVLIISILLNYFIEQPFLKLKDKLLSKSH